MMTRQLRIAVWALAIMCLTSASALSQPNLTKVAISLNSGWEFRQTASGGTGTTAKWYPATVPGDIHLDLLANKVIPDPFYRDNEAKLQWIENASWEYRTDFDVTAAVMQRANIDLDFDGLDAAAQVYLNGEKVLDADNMFRIWRVPVKSH